MTCFTKCLSNIAITAEATINGFLFINVCTVVVKKKETF